MTNIEIKINFWKELWENSIDNFLKRSYGLTLYNPHILIDDIISEIEENNFANKDNKSYFYSKLSYYIENDIVIEEKLKSEFKILRQTFYTERIHYVLANSKEIKKQFQKGLYFDVLLNHLKELLTLDEKISLDFINTINYYTQSLIVEFIKKSYTLEDIKKFPYNIFDTYYFREDKTLITNYPHEINSEKYKNKKGVLNKKKYDKDVISHISNLSIKDRIEKLADYYYKKKEEVYYIFVVEGLKGDTDIELGDVIFYSLSKRQFVKQQVTKHNFEELQPNRKDKFIQAAVKVNYLLPESSLHEAMTKLESSLDLISCYFKTETDLYINVSKYSIVNLEGKPLFSTMSVDKKNPVMKYRDSLELKDIDEHLKSINNYSFLWDKNKSISKITNALHWYRKGEQSFQQEDKMLNYWIAIENIFNLKKDIKLDILNDSKKNKFYLIQEILASTQLLSFVYDFGRELYHHYTSIVFTDTTSFPEKLIQNAQLRPKEKEKIYLKNFVDNLDEIEKYEKNLFILDKISTVKGFYTNSTVTKKTIEQEINQIKNDILMIYRFRNMIVHNAYFDNTLLPYFVWKVRGFAGALIRTLIYNFDKEKDLSDLLLDRYLKKEKFLQDLEDGKLNLFKK